MIYPYNDIVLGISGKVVYVFSDFCLPDFMAHFFLKNQAICKYFTDFNNILQVHKYVFYSNVDGRLQSLNDVLLLRKGK